MRRKKLLTLLLALSLLTTLLGCTRPSRRPALPAAPLQSAFTAEEAETNAEDTAASQAGAPMMKSAMVGASPASAPEQTTEELLEAFLQPIDKEGALYQDYTTEHRAEYKKLRQRPEAVIELVLPELLEDPAALERYSDETSRATLLYCLLKDTLQKEPFSWDDDSYRYLSAVLADFIRFVSGHMQKEGKSWFEENAPLTGLCAAVMQKTPSLRLNMTPCEPVTNGQALTNAKKVFAAALEGRDAEAFGFEPWPENIADGFDFTTGWTLVQSETGEVTLTAADSDTGQTLSLVYMPNEAERESLLAGYGSLIWTKADGESVELASQNAHLQANCVRSDREAVQDYEMVLENGVEIGMDYSTVASLTGDLSEAWSGIVQGVVMESRGVLYSFDYDEHLIWRLRGISFYFAADTVTNTTAELPAARGIALGETMQSVFDRLPDGDTTLKRWAAQTVYEDASGARAQLQFVADSFYVLDIFSPGGRQLSIVFARLDNTVLWMDIY